MQFDFDPVLEQITGIHPHAILCVGAGFVREEYKSLCFLKGKSITQNAILNPRQISEALAPACQGRVLEATARAELLRQVFKEVSVREALPLLADHRFRPKFYENLDRSLQQGRLYFAHAEEAQVLQARLNERLGVGQKRDEFFVLHQLWERILELRNLWDEAKVYEVAVAQMRVALPPLLQNQTIFKLEHFPDPPRLQYFWNELAKQVPIEKISSRSHAESNGIILDRKVAHSLEDAALFLVDEILASGDLANQAVVIQDEPALRRTLKRVAERAGIQFNDPRDPTLIVQSEEIKLALLELELVAKNFPAPLVLEWLHYSDFAKVPTELGLLRKKIIESAIQQGVDDYRFLPVLHEKLIEIKSRIATRVSLTQLQGLLELSAKQYHLPLWVHQVFDKIFNEWTKSFAQIEIATRKKPLRYWLEQLIEKLKRATPIAPPIKKVGGLQLFRVDQAVSPLLDSSQTKIHFFGVGLSFFEPKEETNDWFSTREREVLASEFGLPSIAEIQAQNAASYLAWARAAGDSATSVTDWEFLYDEDGGERESTELQLSLLAGLELTEKQELGLHPSLFASMQTHLKTRSPHVQVPLPKTEWPISFLNAYGNCPFTAYSAYLLSLYDEREVDFELKGDSFGNLVHAALETFLQDKITVEDAFERAWKSTAQIAWLKSERLYRSIRYKTILLLHEFEKSEEEYRARAGTQVLDLEKKIDWQRAEFTFHGRIDRIDQHADGLVLMDYKTSSALPNGKEIFEKGLGLQLPVYALALKEQLNQEVVAAQYIHLTAQATKRNTGILFKKWNKSKAADPVEFPVTNARSNSHSIMEGEPAEVWNSFDQKVVQLIEKIRKGYFDAEPADPADCQTCRYQLVCGKLRGGVGSPEAP
jgi:hypothetical protein